MKKTYTCKGWPFLRLGRIQFRDGKYTTEDKDIQDMVERSDWYGVHIQLESQSETAEAAPSEPEAESAPRRGPGRPPSSGARQGTTGTESLR